MQFYRYPRGDPQHQKLGHLSVLLQVLGSFTSLPLAVSRLTDTEIGGPYLTFALCAMALHMLICCAMLYATTWDLTGNTAMTPTARARLRKLHRDWALRLSYVAWMNYFIRIPYLVLVMFLDWRYSYGIALLTGPVLGVILADVHMGFEEIWTADVAREKVQ